MENIQLFPNRQRIDSCQMQRWQQRPRQTIPFMEVPHRSINQTPIWNQVIKFKNKRLFKVEFQAILNKGIYLKTRRRAKNDQGELLWLQQIVLQIVIRNISRNDFKHELRCSINHLVSRILVQKKQELRMRWLLISLSKIIKQRMDLLWNYLLIILIKSEVHQIIWK
jgi:hypothetical protein